MAVIEAHYGALIDTAHGAKRRFARRHARPVLFYR